MHPREISKGLRFIRRRVLFWVYICFFTCNLHGMAFLLRAGVKARKEYLWHDSIPHLSSGGLKSRCLCAGPQREGGKKEYTDIHALQDGNEALCAEDSIENGGMRSEQNKTLSSRAGAKKKLRAIRQHVNPLSSLYQRPANISAKWVEDAFANPSLPFHIDIGSARGRFCIYMAREHPDMNFLGLEIRRPCVEESFKKMEKYRVKDNVHFLALNVNVDLERIVADVRKHSEIVRYSVQFPDPHFKAKHKKRRVIQPALVACMCSSLKSDGGEIFIQSDVEEVAVSMRDAFKESTLVADASASGAWMEENPLKVPTEREVLTLSRGDPVYRTVFCRDNH